ncbi:MAG: hypothetical protein ACW98X_22220 [Promethearchaeota archaeon]|jgi:hypothetical protein
MYHDRIQKHLKQEKKKIMTKEQFKAANQANWSEYMHGMQTHAEYEQNTLDLEFERKLEIFREGLVDSKKSNY